MIELFKDHTNPGKWVIRNGILRRNCVVDDLTIKDLSSLMKKIDKIVNKFDRVK